MAQDLNTLLQAFKDLAQASREPGKLSPEHIEREVKKLTAELQQTLATMSTQLKAGDSPESAYMVELFQAQIRQVLDQNGLKLDNVIEEDESEKLSQELAQRKRGPVRT